MSLHFPVATPSHCTGLKVLNNTHLKVLTWFIYFCTADVHMWPLQPGDVLWTQMTQTRTNWFSSSFTAFGIQQRLHYRPLLLRSRKYPISAHALWCFWQYLPTLFYWRKEKKKKIFLKWSLMLNKVWKETAGIFLAWHIWTYRPVCPELQPQHKHVPSIKRPVLREIGAPTRFPGTY